MKSIINFIVKNKEKNLRVDTLLANQHNKLTRSRVKTLILENNLKINNLITVDPSRKVKLNDEISFNIVEPKKENLKPFKYNLDIIYEDKDLIVINKSAGISMHPGPGNYDNTIVNALINYSGDNLSNVGNELRPGIVHRIDKDTSGLVVIAKNNFSHENLSKQFSEHSITRVYYALVWGKIRPQNGKIETLIARSSKNRQMMEVSFKKGKRAVTNYKTLEVYETKKIPTFSLVECKLETGRTHQIRVHLSNMGNNILGDKKYKKKFKKLINIDPSLEKLINELNRQFLHAKSLGFNHPTNNKRLEFSSNLPSDLENILKKLSKIK
jgi:23S rRNA pseudouridine1911/1915/1917 synthase|tara:strand:- start:364 stop:1341 length:978 start_codon:yes stop_codon:yes gene_type:complete